jgi:hypothetical protein
MTDEEFKQCVQAIALGEFGTDKLPYYALSNDEIAIYLARPRSKSVGVIILNRNGTFRYDPTLPQNDPMLIAKRDV